MKISEILGALEELAPPGTAEAWDNVGLLVGNPNWKTLGAIVSIDLTSEAIAAAKKKGYRLIVNHHPCIFPKGKGLSRLTVPGSLACEALSEGIAVISSHTNFDQCALEVVHTVSRGLGCTPQGRLIEKPEEALFKLVVFVPETHLTAVREVICEAGAGHIGRYDQCTYSSAPGEGTFRPGEFTKPFVGKRGRLEKVKEVRLETVFPRGLRHEILKALVAAHPYEEVAYDLYAIKQRVGPSGLVRGMGYGFWGEFQRPKPFSEVLRSVRSLFNLDGFWLTPPAPAKSKRSIKRVAFVAGKGSSFLSAARSIDCDLFITGEAGYHGALDGSRRGMTVMELGHRESERFFLTTMESWLKKVGVKALALNIPTQKIWSKNSRE
jgi:dinuclear metal center YbgI/SA1388 family protein